MRCRAASVLVLALLVVPPPGRAQTRPAAWASYAEDFRRLYQHIGAVYPCFEMKGIDWKKVGDGMLPRAETLKDDAEFGVLCMELLARLQDSHAAFLPGTVQLPEIPFPNYDPGFACLLDDRDRPVIYYVDRNSPAERAGLHPGQAVLSINDKPADQAICEWMKLAAKYAGYSSDRVLRYDAVRCFCRQMKPDTLVELALESADGTRQTVELRVSVTARYFPRLPVPTAGIDDSANVSWKWLAGKIGYIHVRRIQEDLIDRLNLAVSDLALAGGARGLIIDVRGNSGGGFDADRSFRNFDPDDKAERDRPRYAGPIAILIDERCISAGEGWTSWFVAKRRARLFGSTTAGASSRKETYAIAGGLYQAVVPVKAYPGFLDRPIERRGLEPDVPVRCTAKDLDAGVDTVLEAARKYLLSLPPGKAR